ncbi:MAG: hypothetical protein V8T16_15820 [Parabacteroides merdae]
MIGMDDNPQPKHIEVIIKNVKHDNIFSGGKRHYEIVKPFLPADAVWIEIKASINAVLAEYSRLIQEGKVIVSFVSGDPFFGFASAIRKNLLGVGMKVFPYFNSLQMFTHHEQIPYENMHAVSVTGRPWHDSTGRCWNTAANRCANRPCPYAQGYRQEDDGISSGQGLHHVGSRTFRQPEERENL